MLFKGRNVNNSHCLLLIPFEPRHKKMLKDCLVNFFITITLLYNSKNFFTLKLVKFAKLVRLFMKFSFCLKFQSSRWRYCNDGDVIKQTQCGCLDGHFTFAT